MHLNHDQLIERTLSRLDADGVPTIVQRLLFDPKTGMYRAFYFDGTTTLICGDVKIGFLSGVQKNPTDTDWEMVEHEAILHYENMQTAKQSLVFESK